MRSTNHVAAVAALVCGLAMGTAPFAHGTGGEILSGTYDVVTPTSVLDTWTITPQCIQAAVGCEADIHSPLIDGQAYYQGAYTWTMTIKGKVPVCLDKSKTTGAMTFQWNAQSLDGQLTRLQQGVCQMTRPGQDQVSFKLVKA